MSTKSIAEMPAVANLSAQGAKLAAILKKVPLSVWRTAITALAIFWVVHTLANLFWKIFPAPELPVAPVMPSSISIESKSAGRKFDIEPVQALNLFGEYNAQVAQQEEEPPPQTNEPLPPTKLNVELLGVIASSEAENSWAIIGSGASQKLYKSGDELETARGVKVQDIYPKKVVLNNRGKLEELKLYGDDGMEVASSNYTPPPRNVPSRPEPEKAVVSQDQLKQAKNIGDVVRFMVATENGKMIGYKVRPGRQRELFDQVGLKTDDIVVSVNGIEVNEPQKVREVYQALKTATEANLQVQRDGALHSITITMSQ